MNITNAMFPAMEKTWRYGRGITSLVNLKRYAKDRYAIMTRFDTNLRGGKYPADTMADYRILLQRVSTFLVLLNGISQQDSYYWASD